MSTKKILAVLSGVALLVVGGYVYMRMQPKPVPAPVLPVVEAYKIQLQEIYPEISFVAKTESQDKVGLRARITGFLQERLFQEGEVVQKDQPLFVIEQVNFEAAVREAEANYDKAVANAKNATNQYERMQKLYKTKDVSKSKLDEAEASYGAAKASVAQMKALLDLAKKDLEYTVIKAPMDGKVGESTFSVGELISPNSGVLARVVKIDPMDVVFSVSENELSQLRRLFPALDDVEAQFIFSDNLGYDQKGSVDFADVTLDEQMNTLKMKASFENPDQKLISGQYGRIKLKGTQSLSMFIIPQKAVQRTATEEFVFVVKPNNTLERRLIKTGMELPNYKVEITEGVNAGESVVVEGFQKIAPGAQVQPQYEQE